MQSKGKWAMVDNNKCELLLPLVDGSGAKEEMAEWVKVLLRTKFWEPCSRGHAVENRAEGCIFCLQCYEVFCPHCTHDEPDHRLIKVRRYVYRTVVLAKEMHELNIDVSRVQTYVINSQKGVHLRPMRRSPQFRPSAGAPRCLTCSCWLRTAPNLFCSLTCKGKADVSQDDFSGPEAEHRYRNLQAHMTQPLIVEEYLMPEPELEPEFELEVDLEAELEPDPQLESESKPELEVDHRVESFPLEQIDAPLVVANPLPNNGSFRMRRRKQIMPLRAPFF